MRLAAHLLTASALAWGMTAGNAWGAGPLRGNPVDSLPAPPEHDAERPKEPPLSKEEPADAVRSQLDETIVPRHFSVAGNRAMPLDELRPILARLVGRAITVRELVREMDKITALYRERGYVLSFALLQEQDFHEGLVVVTVVEGHIASVDVSGDAPRSVRRRLDALARPLLAEKPLTRATLERTLNLMRRVPGLRLDPKLEMPRRADGSTALALHVSHKRLGVAASVADLGTGYQMLVDMTANSISPLGEQVKLTAAIPRTGSSVRYVSGSVAVPIGTDGLSAELDGYHYNSHPEDDLLEAAGWSRRVVNEQLRLSLKYPFVLENQRSLTGGLGVYAGQSIDEYQRDADNAWLQHRTHVRAARASFSYRETGQSQSREVLLDVHKGFDALGAKKSRRSNYAVFEPPSYDLDFTRYVLGLKQTVKLDSGVGLVLSAIGQYSRNVLPSSEQISFGGWRYGLGYPPGELAGDKGYGVSLEVNRRFATGWNRLTTVQPYVVADHAQAWYNEDGLYDWQRASLASVAVGIRLSDERYFVADLNVARPLRDSPYGAGRGEVRVNFNFSLAYDAF
ncbi:ShlB/FhaC/HecB family hemolysin secretion/activation protein [Pusillimonas caeni]|uniref:ShlB/FhaC/HecB family hemolysin secretion/activation protein n=1 Tax=Pusillimonas caeni TaxID=1348472 RepID=UPI001FD7AFCB|nr:POTRA domain-containing protein [Pusillimonas caeni]